MSNKEKLIEVLRMIDPNEASKAEAVRTQKIIDVFEKNDADWGEKLTAMMNGLSEGFSKSLNKHGSSLNGKLGELAEALSEHGQLLDKHFGGLSEKMETLKPTDYSGYFKDFPTLLAEQTKHSKRGADLISNLKWNASMQVRNENGSPMTPYGVSPKVQDGTTTVVTSGTAVQLSSTSVPCYGVYVTAHESNTGTVVVGDSTVVAALVGRRGYALYPTNSQKFSVTNANLLYIDSTVSGDKVHFYVERQF